MPCNKHTTTSFHLALSAAAADAATAFRAMPQACQAAGAVVSALQARLADIQQQQEHAFAQLSEVGGRHVEEHSTEQHTCSPTHLSLLHLPGNDGTTEQQ